MDRNKVKEQIEILINKYQQVANSGKLGKYTEEETKKDFISPLFQTLGWVMNDKNEVTAEEQQSSGRIDYGFYLDGKPKFFLEAKSFKTDLHKEEFANQAIRYSWNKGITWAVLTDFERIKVFNAQNINSSLSDKLFFEIKYTEYISRFDQLWLLSKEAFRDELLDKEAIKYGKKLQRVSVTQLLYKDLDRCREILTHDLSIWNPQVDKDLLDEGVQKLLDRLIFLRVAEDRKIESQILIPLVREWELKGKKEHLYQSMVKKFREFDEVYNSNLFSEHPFEKWEEYSGATEKVINILYGKKGYYEYDFQAMPADVLGSVYENYLGYRLNKSKKGLAVSKDANKRKEHGIYYTPDFIVDYIVKNTLIPVLDKCTSIYDLKKVKVLDPACGSGSFLIKALEIIYNKYKEFGNPGGVYTKINILLENIYGVDLDPQAVEITRLNVLICALDTRMKLPGLDKNIRNGNSLISGKDEELKKYFGINFRDKKPFNWQEKFPEVFKQGGFDVIIGNPPYINAKNGNFSPGEKDYFNSTFKASEYQLDSYILFIEKCLYLLNNNGVMGLIIPNSWLSNVLFTKIRKLLLENAKIIEIIESKDKIFSAANVDTVVLIIEKELSVNKNNYIQIGNFINENYQQKGKILQDSLRNQNFVFNINSNDYDLGLIDKIDNNSIKINNILDISTGIKEYQVGKGKPPQTQNDKDQLRFNSNCIKDNTFVPEIRGKNINNYCLDWNNEYISYGKWLAEPRQEKYFKGKRILLRKIPGLNRLIATYIEENFIVDQSLYIGIVCNTKFNVKYILGIINSRLIGWYFKNKNNEFDALFPQIKITQFKDLPIANFDINSQNELALLVDKILQLNKELRTCEKDSDQWNSIKEEIEKTDKRIDEEVYKLYGLTEEEIGIVEGVRSQILFNVRN